MKILIKALILVSLFVASCTSNGDKEVKTLLINSFKVPCTGVAPRSCLQIKDLDKSSNWSNFYSPIEGFTFEPGFLHTIEVVVEALPEDQVPADGSSQKYTLLRIIDKQKDVKLNINDIWVLQTMEGDVVAKVFKRLPYLEVHVSSSKYMGNDGCNNYHGTLDMIDALQIRFGVAASTRMSCPNDDWSFKYMGHLANSNNYRVENGTLLLFQDEKELLTFKKAD